MEYLSPPTTPKKQRLLGSPSRAAVEGVAAMTLSPDRYIPNRSHVDFDYCQSMLSPGNVNENGVVEGATKDKKALAMERHISAAMMGGGGSGGKRMIEVFESPAEHKLITEPSLKVRALSHSLCLSIALTVRFAAPRGLECGTGDRKKEEDKGYTDDTP